MGLEKFVIRETENIVNHERLSREILDVLENFCAKLIDLKPESWKNVTKKVMENGRTVTIGNAGAKSVVSPKNELSVYRKLVGYGEELADGTPTLNFRVQRPSGTTILRVKPNLNGTFSPVRL